jgi:pimeloyl-ACP methyl ester carboxylesterase
LIKIYSFEWVINNEVGFLTHISDPNKKTLLFIHGFGFGYVPYIKLLLKLYYKYNLIIIVLPNISNYNYNDDFNYTYFPSLELISTTLYNYLESKKYDNIILLSHSFGTYITQFLRKDLRQKIFKKIILVDPIIFWIGCFKMSLHVDNPFVKKYPLIDYFLDNLLSFMIYQCINLKYVIYRVMFGPDFWIYDASELTNTNLTIVLQKNDYVIPAELLYNKIKNNVKCFYFNNDNMIHGTILMDNSYINDVINIIEN